VLLLSSGTFGEQARDAPVNCTFVGWSELTKLLCSSHRQIKVTKLNCYEEKYEKRVTEAREKELFHLQKELAVWALTLVLIVISPIIATSATFAVYVLIDEDNVLTASRSFSVLLLFSALRFPINFAGRLLGSTFYLLGVRVLLVLVRFLLIFSSFISQRQHRHTRR